MTSRILIAVLAAAILTACSAQTAAVQPAAPVSVGTTQDTGNGAKVTLHEIRDNITRPTYTAAPGDRWVGLDVEVCVDAASTINAVGWQLNDTRNHTYLPESAFSELPGAGYVEGVLNGGTCRRGWLPYEMPLTETVATVTYSISSGLLTWK